MRQDDLGPRDTYPPIFIPDGAGGIISPEPDAFRVNPLLEPHLAGASLAWFPEAGFGYYEVPESAMPYDATYFARYQAQAATPLGRSLMAARDELVSRYWGGGVLDVGIGSGAFLLDRRLAGVETDKGYDVNPCGVEWLKAAGLWGDLYAQSWPVATFWDALEHIRRPDLALAQVSDAAFVAIPVFTGPEHVLASKHYRRDEHFWYWTREGFCRFAGACGFDVVDIVATETALGRDGIETFVLRRSK